MSKNSKRQRIQKTAASDIAPNDTRHQFTHSSNTPTHTCQVVTTSRADPLEPIHSPSDVLEMDQALFDDYPISQEDDPPAGVEVLTKGQRYLNSVKKILNIFHLYTNLFSGRTFADLEGASG